MSIHRERTFWDAQARGVDLAALRREAESVAGDRLWRWALERVAERRPERILDLGCGRGATTLLLARTGARVTAVDLSAESIRAARALTHAEGLTPGLIAATIEALPFPAGSFDLVAGRFVLHHAESLALAAAEVRRVLRPGGAAVFVETWGGNPLLRFGRDLAQLTGIGLGTADERPIGDDDLRTIESGFRVEVHFPVFTAFELSDRLWRALRPVWSRSRRIQRLVGRAWERSIAADRWVERRIPLLRSRGWFAGLVLLPRP